MELSQPASPDSNPAQQCEVNVIYTILEVSFNEDMDPNFEIFEQRARESASARFKVRMACNCVCVQEDLTRE